ncbi:MurR/RpiR family transcriptional regulator [Helcococcus bovis]|uniref:MurR/RpiR family transcriptional regulator n=1 Tax=Helcococcus bovis TaxID=3153252 RepID=UPI0038BBACF0
MKKFTETEKYLIDFMDKNTHRICELSITELSALANVSTTTIFRTVKKLGFNGFSEYKFNLISNIENKEYFDIIEEKDRSEIKNIISKNQQEVNSTINKLNIKSIYDSINYLRGANTILIFARGLSELVAQEIQVKFQLLDKRCDVYTDPNIIRKISKKAKKDDCILYISLEGETKELVDASISSLQNEIPSILITTNINSSLAKNCNIIIEGYKSTSSYFPDYEVRSRLSLNVISRILLDCYSYKFNISLEN